MANIVIKLDSAIVKTNGKIYKDIKVPLTDDFAVNYDRSAVRNSLFNIFNWRRGQRILNPLFGNIIYEYVYEPLNDITLKNLRAGVLQMLEYEPRISIISLDITPNIEQHTIYVQLKYIIPKLNIIDSYDALISIISK